MNTIVTGLCPSCKTEQTFHYDGWMMEFEDEASMLLFANVNFRIATCNSCHSTVNVANIENVSEKVEA